MSRHRLQTATILDRFRYVHELPDLVEEIVAPVKDFTTVSPSLMYFNQMFSRYFNLAKEAAKKGDVGTLRQLTPMLDTATIDARFHGGFTEFNVRFLGHPGAVIAYPTSDDESHLASIAENLKTQMSLHTDSFTGGLNDYNALAHLFFRGGLNDEYGSPDIISGNEDYMNTIFPETFKNTADHYFRISTNVRDNADMIFNYAVNHGYKLQTELHKLESDQIDQFLRGESRAIIAGNPNSPVYLARCIATWLVNNGAQLTGPVEDNLQIYSANGNMSDYLIRDIVQMHRDSE